MTALVVRARWLVVMWVVVVTVVTEPHGSLGFPTGAPEDVCEDMVPQHDGSNALAGSPYSLYTSHEAFSYGSRIQVRIVGTYEGFLLQARLTNSTRVVGSWDSPPRGTQHLLCTTLKGAVTHSSKVDKHDQNFTWIAPEASPAGSIQATVIKEKLEWQMNVTSSIITTTGYVAPTKAPAITTTTTKKTTTEKPGNSADCLAAPVLWLTLGALLTAARVACGV
ncbi:putative defense protein 1 isoform X2 [Lethenteron reissneri]|uniref:putative defense protein 1 isoform X2 n=1 Tax=Lethenteron reissneri TaxID=7753 RepID=UPI002AB70D95|nr:putative defense protein 1 isoform X2 [Lethenteron reissneri]